MPYIESDEIGLLHQNYTTLYNKLENKRSMIDGTLNRIAVTDDEEQELPRLLESLKYEIRDYITIARETHDAFIKFDTAWRESKQTKNELTGMSKENIING